MVGRERGKEMGWRGEERGQQPLVHTRQDIWETKLCTNDPASEC